VPVHGSRLLDHPAADAGLADVGKSAAGAGGGNERIKISMNMLRTDLDALKKWAAEEGTSMTEIIRRSLVILRYLEGEVRDGRRISLQADGRPDKELVLPTGLR
jgi:hypothetical protein